VEVRECFSSPEILELKAQCELARYRSATSNRLLCPVGLAGPVFEEVSRYLCRKRINCLSWMYKFFVHNATAVEKAIIIFLNLDLLMRAFVERGELFVCQSSLSCSVSGS